MKLKKLPAMLVNILLKKDALLKSFITLLRVLCKKHSFAYLPGSSISWARDRFFLAS